MEGSSLILDEIISKIKSIDGIVLYSLFQLPINETKENTYIQKF